MSQRRRSPRLLYVSGFDFPTAQARGVQTVHTAHALARAGWRVRLLAQRPARATVRAEAALAQYGLEPHPRLQIEPLPVVRLDRVRRLEIHKRLAVTNWTFGLLSLLDLARHGRRIDAIFTRDPRLAWLFLKTRPIHRRPVVYEVHEIFSVRPRDNTSLAAGAVWGVADRTRALERSVFGGVDALLPLTQACADLLVRDLQMSSDRIRVVPDGTSAPPPGLPRRDPRARTVVYAGQLYPWKGVDALLRAMALLADARLIVYGGLEAGGRPDPDLEACQALAARLGIAERTELAGFVPHGQIRARLAGAGVAVVPLPDRLMSRYFTSPLKVFDYMAAGVPIVATDLPALREILVDGRNALLVPPEDPRAMAAAIGRVLDDPALAERLRGQALFDVRDYTWDRRADRIIDAIAPLVGA